MKLTIDNIAKRFPFGVKVQHTHFIEFGKKVERVDSIESISLDCISFKSSCDFYFNDEENECDIKLILFHPCSLTKEITINGETFVPLVELAKKEFGDNYISILGNYNNEDSIGIYLTGRGDTGGDDPQYTYGRCVFCFDKKNISISFIDCNEVTHCSINSEYKIINKLLEWHIDIEGLIDQNLAIDATINNPYK